MCSDPKIFPLRGAKNRPKPSFLGVSEQISATKFFGLRPKNFVAKQGGVSGEGVQIPKILPSGGSKTPGKPHFRAFQSKLGQQGGVS